MAASLTTGGMPRSRLHLCLGAGRRHQVGHEPVDQRRHLFPERPRQGARCPRELDRGRDHVVRLATVDLSKDEALWRAGVGETSQQPR